MNTDSLQITKIMSFPGAVLPLILLLVCATSDAADRGLSRNLSSDGGGQETMSLLANSNYYAIVIGNNDYKDPDNVWTPLATAVSDATTVSEILTTVYGFKTKKLLNASRRDILTALTKLRGEVGENDHVLVYYAGHGWMNPDTKEAYWIPVDAVGMDDSYFLSNSRIKEKLATIADQVGHTLLVSDSCFSGTLLRGKGNSVPDEYTTSYFQKVSSRRSVQILAAGGKEFVDDNYRNSGHSPYTYFFLNELQKNQEKYITVTDLSNKLAHLVSNNVSQTPHAGVLYGAGDEGGEFIFRRTDITVTTKTKTTTTISPRPGVDLVPQGSVNNDRDIGREERREERIKTSYTSSSDDYDNEQSRYLDILEDDPNNKEAKQGLKRIANRLVNMALDETDYKRSLELINEAQEISPGLRRLGGARDKIMNKQMKKSNAAPMRIERR